VAKKLRTACSRKIVHAMTSVDSIHSERVDERQQDEDKDRPLLGEPKAHRKAAEVELVERLNEDDAEEIGNNKPDRKECDHQTKILMPMRMNRSF